MPVWILTAIPIAISALIAVCAIALMVGPFVIPLWGQTMDELKRKKFVAALKGVNDQLAILVNATSTDLDNRVAEVLRMVERELGKVKGKDAVKLESIARSVVAKSALPISGNPVAVAVGNLGKLDLKSGYMGKLAADGVLPKPQMKDAGIDFDEAKYDAAILEWSKARR